MPQAPATFRVANHLGRPVVFIDDQPVALCGYSPTRRVALHAKQTARFFPHDVTVFFLNIPRAAGHGDYQANPFWVGDRIEATPQLDPEPPDLDAQAGLILNARPDVFFIVRFGPGEPASWRDLHPDDLTVNELGERLPYASLASQRYWRDSATYIRSVITYCEGRPWRDRIIGYWTGHKTEGSHPPVIAGWVFDHSEVMQRRWRAFLREKYGADVALREAWDDASVTLDTAVVPRDRFRRPLHEVTQDLYWQVGPAVAPLHDYFELIARLYHEGFVVQADAHRAATRRPCFFLVDALKQSMLGWHNRGFFDPRLGWPTAFHEMQSSSGNTAVTPLIEHPGIDGLITPHDYHARGVGGVYEPEGPADSCVLRGKLFLCEMDTRSWTGIDGPVYGSARHADEFAAVSWRNVATTITRGFHSYYMDVHTDWFGDEAIHAIIHRQVRVLRESVHWPHAAVPGIAMVLDDACVFDTNGDGAYLHEAVMWEQKQGLARCGVPFRIHLFDDLKLDALPPHRVWYFPNLFRVTDERLALLHQRVFRDGNVVVWGPGSGISDGRRIGVESASRLTGFKFDMLAVNHPRRVHLHDLDHVITRDCTADTVLGGPLSYGPLLWPTDGEALGMAWTKQGRVATGLAVKRMGGADPATQWTSVFTTAVPLPAALWRGLARCAGAHVYHNGGDVLLANCSVVALHTTRAGRHTLRLPRKARVTDVIADQLVGDGLDTIAFDLARPATAMFHLA